MRVLCLYSGFSMILTRNLFFRPVGFGVVVGAAAAAAEAASWACFSAT